MKTTLVTLFVVVVLSGTMGLYAQEVAARTMETQTFVSLEDLQKELEKTAARLENLQKQRDVESALKSAEEKQVYEHQLQTEIKLAKEREIALQSRIDQLAKDQKEAADEQQKKIWWNGIYIASGVVGVILLALGGFTVWFRKNHGAKIQVVTEPSRTNISHVLPKRLENPKDANVVWKLLEEYPVLKVILERDGDLEIEASLRMPVRNTPFDNRESDCKILLVKGSSHLQVNFEDGSGVVAWPNRFAHMANVTLPYLDCKKTQEVS